jgi:hypothetical protein
MTYFEYKKNSIYPSVTQVISPHTDFSMIPPTVLEIATARGSMVHDLCARHAQGEWIVPDLIREDCRGYFDSFLQWFELVETVHLVEEELIDEVYGFCGHPDMIVTMIGTKHPRVVDLKTPVSRARAWKLQISAYNRLAEVKGFHVEQSGTLRLSPRSRVPAYDEYTDSANDFNYFLNCLYSWKYFNED